MRRVGWGALAWATACRVASAAEEATREVSRFRFLEAPPAWVVALVVVPAVAAFAWFAYGKERSPLGRRSRILLGGLRALVLLAVAVLLFRPVRETREVDVERAVVPVIVDVSASMQRSDRYADSDTAAALADSAGLASAAQVATTPRIELVRRVLDRLEPGLEERLRDRAVVRWFSFGEELRALTGLEDLAAEAPYTRLGSAVASVVGEFAHRGKRVSEIVVFSDGRNNSGMDPLEAADRAALDGVRLVTVGVGDPAEPQNLEIRSLRAPDVALVHDDVAFEVVIAGTGYEGRTANLVLKNRESGEVLASSAVRIPQDERDQNEALYWRPEREGEYDLAVSLEPLDGEQFLDDNVRRHHIRVDPEEIRVLYVEGYPRWEYRYLKNTLLRAKNLKVQCLLLDADKDFIQESSEGLPALERFPSDREKLFQYDVVILGDVAPYALGETVEESERILRHLKEFVELGGGMIFIAGVLDNPRSYVGTPLEDVLPVVVGDGEEERRIREGGAIEPFRPKLEKPFDPPDVVRLEKDLEKNRRLWEDPEVGLPPQEWYFPVRKAKGGAEVMLRHPTNGNAFGRHVLLASTFYPNGRTLFVAFDSTWLWRRYYRDRYTERFWRAAVRHVAVNRLRRANKRFNLLTDKTLYDINEPVRITATVREPDFEPAAFDRLSVRLSDENGRISDVVLSSVSPEEGRFEGTIRLAVPGAYQVWIEDWTGREEGRQSPRTFRVEVPQHEWRNPVLDETLLRSLAERTGGAYLRLAEIERLDQAIQGGVRERPRGAPSREELWSGFGPLLAIVGLLAGEWILRKRHHLL